MNLYLIFSDGAKFADIARNLVNGLGYGSKFNFWSGGIFDLIKNNLFPSYSVPPIMPFSIALFFKIFGVTDFAVVATSFFYFVLTIIFVFLLSRKVIKSNLIAWLSAISVGFNYNLINFATSGASESPFIFEITAATYFISVRKRWADCVAALFIILMYFTRPQAFIYISGLILYYLCIHLSKTKALICFLGIVFVGLAIDRNVLPKFTGNSFLYSVTVRGIVAVSQVAAGSAVSDSLRGTSSVSGSNFDVLKNVFYNIYNFYKLMPQIMNPYLFGLFLIGLFRWKKDRVYNSLQVTTVFIFFMTLVVTAVSIPFFRYIHPTIPLIYILAVGTLVELVSSFQFPVAIQILNFKFRTTQKTFIILASTFLILFFGVGQTLGIIFLDSRFEANTHNTGQPPAYVRLSWLLRDNTGKNDLVLTNLDTWGTWYGERKTVWFPLAPKQLIDPATGKIPFDAIYLTSYLIDDENYYMGADWRTIFNNPTDSKGWTCERCDEIAREFRLEKVFKISASEDYDRQEAWAVLLIKK